MKVVTLKSYLEKVRPSGPQASAASRPDVRSDCFPTLWNLWVAPK